MWAHDHVRDIVEKLLRKTSNEYAKLHGIGSNLEPIFGVFECLQFSGRELNSMDGSF